MTALEGSPGGAPSNRPRRPGHPEQITDRVQQHVDATADHVGVQLLADNPDTTAHG